MERHQVMCRYNLFLPHVRAADVHVTARKRYLQMHFKCICKYLFLADTSRTGNMASSQAVRKVWVKSSLLRKLRVRNARGPREEVEGKFKCEIKLRSNKARFTFLLALKNDASKASSASIWFSCSLMYCVKTVWAKFSSLFSLKIIKKEWKHVKSCSNPCNYLTCSFCKQGQK